MNTSTTFKCTYSTLSKNITVEKCYFVDYAIATNKNENWKMKNTPNVSITDNYTSLSNGNTNYFIQIPTNSTIYFQVNKQNAGGGLFSFNIYNTNGTLGTSLTSSFTSTELNVPLGTFVPIKINVSSTGVTATNLNNNTSVTKTFTVQNNICFTFWIVTNPLFYKDFYVKEL